jgi:hypothetical protein
MRTRENPTTIRRRQTIKRLKFKRKTVAVLFSLSLLINAYVIHRLIVLNDETKTTVVVKNNDETQKSMVDKIYNLSNYRSVSKYSASAQDRFNKLDKAYSQDIETPKEKLYSANGNVKGDWARYCKDRVRRIVNLQSRVYDLETVLDSFFNGVDKTSLTTAIKSKGYEEKLSEMSNYYASFLDEYSYNLIVQTVD